MEKNMEDDIDILKEELRKEFCRIFELPMIQIT